MVSPETSQAVDAPTLLTPSDGDKINDPTPTFTWSITGGSADFIHIEVAYDSGFTSIADEFQAPVSSYTSSTDYVDDLYFWHIRARDSSTFLWSTWSETWDFSIDTTPPGTPLLQSPGANEHINNNDPLYDWNSVPFANYYNIEVATDIFFLSKIIDAGAAVTQYDGIPLADGTYYWQVSARDEAGNWGNPSPYRTFYVDTVAPSWPDSIYPLPSAYSGFGFITFVWAQFAPEENHYQFQIGYDSFFTSIHLDVEVDINNHTTLFHEEDVYYWHVRARDLAGNWGDWGTTRTVTIDLVYPTMNEPEDIIYTIGDTNNYISWTAIDLNALDYILYLNDELNKTGSWESGIPIIIDVDGLDIGTYNFTIVVEDKAGNEKVDTVIVNVVAVINEYGKISYLIFLTLVILPILIKFRKKRK
ncbi:MAG: hypothetical protein GOP50_13380 [Candidatus Heimdallarchaeota archaeon]|nr:hypothetical protein [Candidatus Heimdallarchaeota archaeon]